MKLRDQILRSRLTQIRVQVGVRSSSFGFWITVFCAQPDELRGSGKLFRWPAPGQLKRLGLSRGVQVDNPTSRQTPHRQ